MDKRLQARMWLLALDRFELTLRVKQARTRNAYLKEAAKSYETNGMVADWLDEQSRRRIQVELQEHYRKVVPYFGAMALRQISRQKKASTDMFLSLTSEWISREALRKAKLIAATTRQDVQDAIADGITEGLGTAEIARGIRKVSALTPARASVIARTETHAAATFGSVESVRSAEQDLGVRMLKEWLPTNDGRTRDTHAAMSGYGPIPLDEKFQVGGAWMDRPGDPAGPPEEVVNCRCTLIYTEANN